MEAIKAYLEQIKVIPLLTPEEEIDLVKKAKKGNKAARRKLINANLRLVVSIAKHYSRYALPLMDLIAEGNIGLMRAINKFNPAKGYRFPTYAAWWIRQALTRALIDQGKTIRIPVYMNELMAKYKKRSELIRQKLKREPTRAEIAKKMKLPITKVAEIELWMSKKSSLDAPIGDGDSKLGDFISDSDYTDTTEEVERIFNKERVAYLLDTLTDREKKVLDLRFGITDGKQHTLAEVSDTLNVSRERIRQIENQALEKLKQYVVEEQKNELE